MTSDIFVQHLRNFNQEMKQQNRNIALIVDNCRSHPFIELSNIKVIFLPPNTTSVLQPMDAGVIHSIKSRYRVMLCRKLLALLEVKPNPTSRDFNLFDSIIMLNKSWAEVKVTTIQNCFTKSGFSSDSAVEETDETQDIIWTEITANLGLSGLPFEDYVSADNSIVSSEALNQNNQLIEIQEDINSSEDTDVYDIEEEEEPPVKLIDGLNSIFVLRKYLYQSSGDIESHLKMVDEIENFVFQSMSQRKQSKITDYFH